jgi:hypothetical protein
MQLVTALCYSSAKGCEVTYDIVTVPQKDNVLVMCACYTRTVYTEVHNNDTVSACLPSAEVVY